MVETIDTADIPDDAMGPASKSRKASKDSTGSKNDTPLTATEQEVFKHVHSSQCLTRMFVNMGDVPEPTPEEVAHEVKVVFTEADEANKQKDAPWDLNEEEVVATLMSFYKNAKLSRRHKVVKQNVDEYLASHDLGTHVDLVEFFEMLCEPAFKLALSAECRAKVLELLHSEMASRTVARPG